MAAEVIAGALSAHLCRFVLLEIVSKYVADTEKSWGGAVTPAEG